MIRNVLLVLFICGFLNTSGAWDYWAGKKCDEKHRCIPLRDCPDMFKLAKTRIKQLTKIVQSKICALPKVQQLPLVCCQIRDIQPKSNHPSRPQYPYCGQPSAVDKIFGGTPAPIGAYPWMAAFGYEENMKIGIGFYCAGSLITARYILTAAHCVDNRALQRKKLKVIHLGDWDLSTEKDCQTTRNYTKCSSPHIEVQVEEKIVHPGYEPQTNANDIALLKIDTEIDFGKADVRPVCLPTSGENLQALVRLRKPIAAGWGWTEHKKMSNILLSVKVPILNDKICESRFKSLYGSKQLCVGGIEGFDTCMGDSGAPLVIPSKDGGPPFTQIGIVSFGYLPCGHSNRPAVYTAVSAYMDWINQIIYN